MDQKNQHQIPVVNEEDEKEEEVDEEIPEKGYEGFDEEEPKEVPVDEAHAGDSELDVEDEENEVDEAEEEEEPTVHHPETEDNAHDLPEVHEDEIKPVHHYPTHEEKDNRCRGDDSTQCPGSNVYICSDQFCDGFPDCPNDADEHNCGIKEDVQPKSGW